MKTLKKSHFEALVIARNAFADIFPGLVKSEQDRLEKFTGKQIFKVDGSFMERYKDTDKERVSGHLPDGTHYSAYFSVSVREYDKTLYMEAVLDISGGQWEPENTRYQARESMNLPLFRYPGVLGERLAPSFPEKWDMEAIQAAAKDATDAEKQYEAVLEKVPYELRKALYLSRLQRY